MSHSKISLSLPTGTSPPRIQEIIGKLSSISSDVEEFRGIPYASVPGRWQHSILNQELPADQFDATCNGPKCPQPPGPNNSDTFQAHLDFPSDVTESEFNCLNLLIQRPSQEALRKISGEQILLPVFIWIHGGGFGFGAATDPMWDPTRLVLQSITLNTPIIVVSINYRLNVFGFLGSEAMMPENSRGLNFGLQDQHQALKWISHNIPHFGGDISNITIAGQSAGAASVHAHVLNARSTPQKPLFRRAVLMSGSIEVLGPNKIADANKKWDVLCKHLNAEGNAEERLGKLREVETQKLVDASWELGWMGFSSVVDGISIFAAPDKESDFKVSFDDEGTPVLTGDEKSIRVLIGETNNEGNVFVAAVLPKFPSFTQISSNFHNTYPSPASASEILEAYKLTPNTSLPGLHAGIVQFVADTMFGFAGSRAASFMRKQVALQRATTVKNYSVQFGNPFPGPNFGVAHHCVDLIYLFDAFHDFLAEADKKEAASDDGTYRAKKSNSELTLKVQRDWLAFITKEAVDEDGSEGETSIKVYGHDRIVREEGLETKHWAEQKKRFELLQRNWACAKEVLGKLWSA